MSGLQWFRLYHRIVDDEKLRLLAFEDRWHFVALCCLKADGLLDTPDDNLRARKIAVKLGVQVRELEEIGRRLQEVDLVDELLSPIAWDELQYKSDNSTARVKKYREKQQRNSVERERNVSVTRQDTDTDTELEPKGSCASSDAPAKPEFDFIAEWNSMASQHGLSKCLTLNGTRRRQLKQRLAEHGPDGLRQAIAAIGQSDWHTGRDPKSGDWRAGPDFVLQASSCLKMLERETVARPQPINKTPEWYLDQAAFFEKIGQLDNAAEYRRLARGPTVNA